MSTLQDLKTKYMANLLAQAAEQVRQEQEIETLRQLKLDGLKPRILTWIANREGVDEAELSQYGEVTGNWDDYEDTKLRHAIFTLTIPKHQPMTFTFYEDNESKIRPNNKYWLVDQSGRYPDTLGEALVLAAEVYQSNQEYLEREEADSRDYEARQAANEERDQRDLSKKVKQLEELAKDPIAYLLMQLFMELQRERWNTSERVSDLEEAMSNMEYSHDASLSSARNRIEQERQEAERVKDEARSLQYRVDDLDSELQKAKKQGRGW